MVRFLVVCVALLLVPVSVVLGEELKPKFGDIGGVFYTEVSEDREACRQAIKNKIALCRQNTSFVSNTKDRKYPGCLPIFEQQAEICVAHFRRQASSCEIQGSARITDFTGFACTVTATVVEGGEEKTLNTKDATTIETSDDPLASLNAERRKREAAWPKCEAAISRHRAAMSKQATCFANTPSPACSERYGPAVGITFQETGRYCCSPVRFDFECDAYEEMIKFLRRQKGG